VNNAIQAKTRQNLWIVGWASYISEGAVYGQTRLLLINHRAPHCPGCPYNSQREGIIVSNFSSAWVPSFVNRPPPEREAKTSGLRKITSWGTGYDESEFCDVTCDITLASMPLG
jgi:hypothetical protein